MPRLTIPVLAGLLLVAAIADAQEYTFRVVSYNLLQYDVGSNSRNPAFSLVMDEIAPDIILAQEMGSEAGAQDFIDEVLDPALWDHSDDPTVGTSEEYILYRSDRFELLSHDSVPTDLRNHELFRLRALDVPGQPTLLLASTHLKASQGEEDRRYLEVMALVDHMDEHDLNGTDFLIAGDLNLYTSSEPAYQALLNDAEFEDPIDRPGSWHDNIAFADIHTQSPLTYGPGVGGMDDRFDFILAQPVLFDSLGWDLDPLTYTAFGNDGEHFNGAINDGTNGVVSQQVADALCDASDHLPVFADLLYFLPDGTLLLTLTPAVDHPVLFPGGGLLEFTARISNLTDGMLTRAGWTGVILPNGNPYGPLVLYNTLHFPANQTITTSQQQTIPGFAPGGTYTFVAKVGTFPGEIDASDQFEFTKLGAGNTATFSDWLEEPTTPAE